MRQLHGSGARTRTHASSAPPWHACTHLTHASHTFLLAGKNFTLSMLGGSVTEGHGGTESAPSWPVQLFELLNSTFHNPRWVGAGLARLARL